MIKFRLRKKIDFATQENSIIHQYVHWFRDVFSGAAKHLYKTTKCGCNFLIYRMCLSPHKYWSYQLIDDALVKMPPRVGA